jgi:dihydropteroate synthase
LDKLEEKLSSLSPLTFLRDNSAIQALNPNRSTLIMSILNMTPDSFSDGGKHHAQSIESTISKMLQDGADILDIGGESTRPGSIPVSPEEELSRILPAIQSASEVIAQESKCISIDTYRASVAAAAIDNGAHIINDISGGTLDPSILRLVGERNIPIILGHLRGTPQTMTRPENTQYTGSVAETVSKELSLRLKAAEDAGIRRWRILLDPGFGFSKNYASNVELLRDFHLLPKANLKGSPWVAGLSRKRFVRKLAGEPDAESTDMRKNSWWMEKGTDGALMAAIHGGADIIRVHNVMQGKALATIGDTLWRKQR